MRPIKKSKNYERKCNELEIKSKKEAICIHEEKSGSINIYGLVEEKGQNVE